MTHGLAHWRDQYPITESKTYLVSHSLGAVPRATADTLGRLHEEWATLGVSAWEGPWWEEVLGFCRAIETILGGADGTVVPFQNATRGMAAVASCFTFEPPRNKVVMTELEFTTSYPFWRGMEELGAEIVLVPSDDGGITVETDRLTAAFDDRTLLVPTSHVYFRSGALQDLKAITTAAHAVGALVLGDGYQAVGAVPVDVADIGIDFYVGGSHKYLSGGAGAGFMYVRPDLIPELRPRLAGWFGLDNPFAYERRLDRGTPNQGVFRFLCGTPNLPAIYAAREGVRNVAEIGVPAIREVSTTLTGLLIDGATERGIEIRTPLDPERRSAMICMQFEGSEAVSRQLFEEGVMLDWRPDCGIRVSPHFYNLPEDIERFFAILDGCLQKS